MVKIKKERFKKATRLPDASDPDSARPVTRSFKNDPLFQISWLVHILPFNGAPKEGDTV